MSPKPRGDPDADYPAEDWAETFVTHSTPPRAFACAPANGTYERKVLGPSGFDTTIDMWLPLSWALNIINRPIG